MGKQSSAQECIKRRICIFQYLLKGQASWHLTTNVVMHELTNRSEVISKQRRDPVDLNRRYRQEFMLRNPPSIP